MSNDNIVTAVTTDPQGHIWLGTRAGLQRFDPSLALPVQLAPLWGWARLIGSLPRETSNIILARLPPSEIKRALVSLSYPEDTAGRYMTPDFVAIDPGTGETLWTCSMHPQIRQPKPGKCPICGMDLVPMATSTASGSRKRA